MPPWHIPLTLDLRPFELRLLASSFLLLNAPAYAQAQTGACQELVLYNSAVATMDAHNTMVHSVRIHRGSIGD